MVDMQGFRGPGAKCGMDDVQPRLVELGGGDHHVVLEQAQQHQQTPGAAVPSWPAVMQLASMFVARPTRNPPGPRGGIGYSTFWLAQGAGPDATVTGIDSDAGHIEQARQLCTNFGLDGPVDFVLGEVTDVLADTPGPVDATTTPGSPRLRRTWKRCSVCSGRGAS